MMLYAGSPRRRNSVGKRVALAPLAGLGGALLLSGAAIAAPRCAADMQRWEGAPSIEYTVRPGDTLTSYAQGEGLSGRDIRRYVDLVAGVHDYMLPQGRTPIGPDRMIYAGDKLRLPDINRDGRVGPAKQD